MKSRRTYITIPEDEYQENKKAADEEDRSFSSFARHAMKQYRKTMKKTVR